VLRPLDALAAHASATFWPRGAIRAAVVGGLGGIVAVVALGLGIPLVSGLVAIVGGFLLLMAVVTFAHEGRVAWRARGSQE
jgi:Flp pilus assembly protein TadB